MHAEGCDDMSSLLACTLWIFDIYFTITIELILAEEHSCCLSLLETIYTLRSIHYSMSKSLTSCQVSLGSIPLYCVTSWTHVRVQDTHHKSLDTFSWHSISSLIPFLPSIAINSGKFITTCKLDSTAAYQSKIYTEQTILKEPQFGRPGLRALKIAKSI